LFYPEGYLRDTRKRNVMKEERMSWRDKPNLNKWDWFLREKLEELKRALKERYGDVTFGLHCGRESVTLNVYSNEGWPPKSIDIMTPWEEVFETIFEG